MKRILLTTTALTMTAGIAAADVSVGGAAKLGFNDTDAAKAGDKLGVYSDVDVTFAMSSTLDNGMAASVTVDVDGDTALNASDAYALALTSDALSVSYGSVEHSAITAWSSGGDMRTDGWFNQNSTGENVLKADVSLGGLAVSASAKISQGAAPFAGALNAAPEPVSIAVSGSLGGASYVIANEGSRMGVSATTAVGGSTVTSAYSTDGTETSTGVKIAYPVGAVTTTVSYSLESATGDTWDIAAAYAAGGVTATFKTSEADNNSLEGTIAVSDNVAVAAGATDSFDDIYLSVTNTLGGGATIMASYAVDGANNDAADEVGGPDLQEGLTVELKFAF
jgi:hypothetical protein